MTIAAVFTKNFNNMIVASVVWHRGTPFTGSRHHDAIKAAVRTTGIKPVIGDQGFLTDDGKYLNRYEAAKYVIETRQPLNGLHTFNGVELYSEDLW